MPSKMHSPEEIIGELREVEVYIGQVMPAIEAIDLPEMRSKIKHKYIEIRSVTPMPTRMCAKRQFRVCEYTIFVRTRNSLNVRSSLARKNPVPDHIFLKN